MVIQMITAVKWVAWDCFLAVLPVALAHAFVWTVHVSRKKKIYRPLAYIFAAVWLAFLPNAPYLITEWRHFFASLDFNNLYMKAQMDSRSTLSLMKGIVFYSCFSGFGVLCFALALRPVVKVLRENRAAVWVYGFPLFGLLSLGVYLGLILRFNSWDLITRPAQVWTSILALSDRPMLSAFLIVFAGFLWMVYLLVDIWLDGFIQRWKEWFGFSTNGTARR